MEGLCFAGKVGVLRRQWLSWHSDMRMNWMEMVSGAGLLESLPLELAFAPELRTEFPLRRREDDGLSRADAVVVRQDLCRR